MLYTLRSAKPDIDQEFNLTRVLMADLLEQSDVISLHTDLNAHTKHMIGESEFTKMKPNAILVNSDRGGTFDQTALYKALKSRAIFAAGLDVTDPEPLPDESPLRQLENYTILPHIGSATFQAREQISLMGARNLIAALAGLPLPFPVG